MRYIPRLPTDYYVDVVWQKPAKRWETFKGEGNRLLFHATSGDFEEAMKNSLAVGLQPDEPAG